ncbi:MAG: PhoH family protein [Candidatus Omnitrophica bacterium]|nr:PhoH family protein [Candidatus Omnitrophota bacterium]
MEKILKLSSNEEAIQLYGSLDENLRYAEKEYHVVITARNHQLKISGDKKNVTQAHRFFTQRLKDLRQHHGPHPVRNTGSPQADQKTPEGSETPSGASAFYHRGKVIRPRSKNQEKYIEAVLENDIVICIGPAGTGKTYLAMAAAIEGLKKGFVSRIVLTRPAVEAGESLGYLPGDFQAKVNPYLRPLYDALHDMMDFDEAHRYIERGVIEVAPLAYMRGRTLNDAFVILDEAQNTTPAQMKMFLTRLGESSKAVITGDVTQIDLPGSKKSGLVEAEDVLTGIKGLKFVHLKDTDVVRHALVAEIIRAYHRYDERHR